MQKLTSLKASAFTCLTALTLAACGGDKSEGEPDVVVEPEPTADGTDTGSDTGLCDPPPMMTDPTTLAANAYACSYDCVPNEQITDFSTETWFGGEWGNDMSLTGNHFTYLGPDTPASEGLVESWDNAAGTMHVSGSVVDYAGWGLAFGPCSDASRWTGIELDVGGDLGGANFRLQVQMNNNYPIDADNGRGACLYTTEDNKWNECTNNEYVIDSITADVSPIQIPFTEITGGMPVAMLQPAELLGLQLQWGCSGDPEAPCVYDVIIDKISFY